MDHFAADFEFKFSANAKDGTFSGYGAIFGNVDSYGDVIERGAFKKTLREWEEKGKLPPMLLQHGGFFGPVDDMLPIGKWNSMEENTKGLKVEGELFALGTDRGQLIYEGMKAGSLSGLSIGYRTRKFTEGTKPNDPRRKLEELELIELSVVTFPANDKAQVGTVKSAVDLLNPRELERELKKFLPGNDAVRAVATVKKHLQREAGGHSPSDTRDEELAVELLQAVKSLRAA